MASTSIESPLRTDSTVFQRIPPAIIRLIIHLLPKTWQQLQRQEAENYYVLGKRHLNEETREANMSNRKSLKLTSIAAREPTCYSDMKYLSDYNFIVANTKW
jgi:hypothetical protein